MKTIWLAGGCFWGVEAYFKQLKGVVDTTVGYGQGYKEQPSYREVCAETTGHAEICEVVYEEGILPLTKVLEHFFRIIDPTSLNRQGGDTGTQYRTGIYYKDPEDKTAIAAWLDGKRQDYSEPIVVEVEPFKSFYPAEDYHQDYLQHTPGGYCHINLALAAPEERK